MQAFLGRPLQDAGCAFVYLNTTYLKGRVGKALQVGLRAVVDAMRANAHGRRELLGLKVGNSESKPFWAEFITSLKERGLTGVPLVMSGAHECLSNPKPSEGNCKAASGKVAGSTSPATCCSGCPGPARALAPLLCALCLPRRDLAGSPAAGMI